MRSSAHINGHPIHPMLVAFPVAYLVGSACVDAIARATRRRDWFRTGRHLNTLGIASALAAAVPGVIDYLLAIPPKSSARTRATNHMVANVSALVLFSTARLGRDRDERPSRWAIAAELCGAGLVTVAGYLGGILVYRNQIGVDHRYANAGTWKSLSVRAAREGDGPAATIDTVDDLDANQMELVHVDGERIVVARTEAGHVAFSDRCTHKGGPLSDGSLACGVVQCPWHGSQFNVHSGEVEQGPAKEPIDTYAIDRDGARLVIDTQPQRADRQRGRRPNMA